MIMYYKEMLVIILNIQKIKSLKKSDDEAF